MKHGLCQTVPELSRLHTLPQIPLLLLKQGCFVMMCFTVFLLIDSLSYSFCHTNDTLTISTMHFGGQALFFLLNHRGRVSFQNFDGQK